MYIYNFKTRSLSTIFDKVDHFVLSTHMERIKLPLEAFEIIMYKENVAIAIKADYVENFEILKIYDSRTQGKCKIGERVLSFSLQDEGKVIFLSRGL